MVILIVNTANNNKPSVIQDHASNLQAKLQETIIHA